MTDSRRPDRGGKSSTDSGVTTSSGRVIFKNKSTASFIGALRCLEEFPRSVSMR